MKPKRGKYDHGACSKKTTDAVACRFVLIGVSIDNCSKRHNGKVTRVDAFRDNVT